jgi:RHS repeat-associated protein
VYGLSRNIHENSSNIKYNHLNLPTSITFESGSKITYLYNAVGTKLGKTVTSVSPESGSVATQTDYFNGFQYKDNGLQFFPTAEGYDSVIDGQKFNYVFNYTDHLGNNRVSYSLDQADQQVKILEENHYDPFGLKHSNYNTDKVRFEKDENYNIFAVLKPVQRGDYQYKYNGKEYQDELGLAMYDYGARNYDPAIGRWMNIDPLAEFYYNHTPYNYVGSNPIIRTDPDGMDWFTDKDGNFHFDPELKSDNAELFFKAKGYKEAKYAFESAVIKTGTRNEESGELENISSSYTLNDDGSVIDNISETKLDGDTTVKTNSGTEINVFAEDSYTSFDKWAKLSGENDPSGAKAGLIGIGLGAGVEKVTTKKVTKNPWYLLAGFFMASAQKQSDNLENGKIR